MHAHLPVLTSALWFWAASLVLLPLAETLPQPLMWARPQFRPASLLALPQRTWSGAAEAWRRETLHCTSGAQATRRRRGSVLSSPWETRSRTQRVPSMLLAGCELAEMCDQVLSIWLQRGEESLSQ